MREIVHDDHGFTCTCGARNEYPSYVKEHWGVRLSYSCSCHRRYILFRGTVITSTNDSPEVADDEAFGD